MANTLDDFLRLALITPGGMTLNLNDFAAYLADRSDGFGMPPFHRLRERGPLQHGETDLGLRLDPRRLAFRITARAETPQQAYDRRAELIRAFAPQDQALILQATLPDDSVRRLDCFLEKGLGFPAEALESLTPQDVIVLCACEPAFYDPAQQNRVISTANLSNLVFAISFPVTFGGFNQTETIQYEGSWYEYPIIELSGPMLNPRIENLTTGKQLYLEYSLPEGELVTIDCRYGYKTIKNNFNSNLLYALSSASDLGSFCLDPFAAGGDNQVRVSATEAAAGKTKVEVKWYTRWLGI